MQTTNDTITRSKRAGTRLYRIFMGMVQRTEDAKHHTYKGYGDRGIKICSEWRHDYWAFFDWSMANGYAEDLSIDRIQNDGPYSPENSRWSGKIT